MGRLLSGEPTVETLVVPGLSPNQIRGGSTMPQTGWRLAYPHHRSAWRWIPIAVLVIVVGWLPAGAQEPRTAKPNILFIMGDDIGWMQPSIYHRGLMVGETPNIDRIGKEGG